MDVWGAGSTNKYQRRNTALYQEKNLKERKQDAEIGNGALKI